MQIEIPDEWLRILAGASSDSDPAECLLHYLFNSPTGLETRREFMAYRLLEMAIDQATERTK